MNGQCLNPPTLQGRGDFFRDHPLSTEIFLCLSVMQQEENMFICLPSEHGWVDDKTFEKHLPPQPGKSHPSDRARGDKEDRARLQIRADNWHKNEEFAFIFYVFVAYTAHMGVHRWILRQCTDRCRESWESQSGESCEQCAGINILSCAGINACCSNHLGSYQKTISAVGGGNCLDLSWEAFQHLNKPD